MTVDLNPFQLFHLRVNNVDTAAALEYITEQHLSDGHAGLKTIYFLNAHCFNTSLDDPEYREALDSCDMLLNDGAGVAMAAKRRQVELRENMNGTDFIPRVVEHSRTLGMKIFLLGAKPTIATKAADEWEKQFPGVNICGTHSGYFDSDEEIVDIINKSDAEILVVGMGVPRQEKWIFKNATAFSKLKNSSGRRRYFGLYGRKSKSSTRMDKVDKTGMVLSISSRA